MDIMRNQKFIIQPHFRLQEWVAEEKGYFRDEGLEYEFREEVQATGGKVHDKGNKVALDEGELLANLLCKQCVEQHLAGASLVLQCGQPIKQASGKHLEPLDGWVAHKHAAGRPGSEGRFR